MKSEFFNLYKDEILKISLSETNWIVANLSISIGSIYRCLDYMKGEIE